MPDLTMEDRQRLVRLLRGHIDACQEHLEEEEQDAAAWQRDVDEGQTRLIEYGKQAAEAARQRAQDYREEITWASRVIDRLS